jgi:hypothetical protein
MTIEQLINRRDELAFRLIEANSEEFEKLHEELNFIELQLNERLELNNEEIQ